jgi:hypothetical protein
VRDLDSRLGEVLAPLQIQTAEPGRFLTCLRCLADATYTARGLCGPCFLFGDRARPSDERTPLIREAEDGRDSWS